MAPAQESRWGREGFLFLGMAAGFVLGYILGGISTVGAAPDDKPKETLRAEQPQGPSRPTQDKWAILEALEDDTGVRVRSIEEAQVIRALFSFYDRLTLEAFEADQRAFESTNRKLSDEERRRRREIFEVQLLRMRDFKDGAIAQGDLSDYALHFFLMLSLYELRVVTPRPLLKLFAEDVMGPVSADFYQAYGVLPETVMHFSDLDQDADPSLLEKKIVFGGKYGEVYNAQRLRDEEREKQKVQKKPPSPLMESPVLKGLLSFYDRLTLEAFEADQRAAEKEGILEAQKRPLTDEVKRSRLEHFEEEKRDMEALRKELLAQPPKTKEELLLWVSRTLGTLRVVTPRPLLKFLAEEVMEPLSGDLHRQWGILPGELNDYSDLNLQMQPIGPTLDTPWRTFLGSIGTLRAWELTRTLVASGRYREPYRFFQDPRRSVREVFLTPYHLREFSYLPLECKKRRDWLVYYFDELRKAGQKELIGELEQDVLDHFYNEGLLRLHYLALAVKRMYFYRDWKSFPEVNEDLSEACKKIIHDKYKRITPYRAKDKAWFSEVITLEKPVFKYPSSDSRVLPPLCSDEYSYFFNKLW